MPAPISVGTHASAVATSPTGRHSAPNRWDSAGGFVLVAILLTLATAADGPMTVAPPMPVPALPAPPAPPPPPDPASPDGVKSLVSLFSVEDYPVEAIRAGEQGTVQVRVMVTTDGRVGNCAVISSSGSIWLDRATCQILQRRARFRPARDDQGRATIDYYTQKVRWQLPPDPLPFSNSIDRVVVRFGDDGSPIACGHGHLTQWAKPEACAKPFALARRLLLGRERQTKGMSLIIERRFEANPTGDLSPRKLSKWEMLLGKAAVEYDIDPAGQPHNCRRLVREGDPIEGDLCALESGREFEPLDIEAKTHRRGRTTITTYLEPLITMRQIDPPLNPR